MPLSDRSSHRQKIPNMKHLGRPACDTERCPARFAWRQWGSGTDNSRFTIAWTCVDLHFDVPDTGQHAAQNSRKRQRCFPKTSVLVGQRNAAFNIINTPFAGLIVYISTCNRSRSCTHWYANLFCFIKKNNAACIVFLAIGRQMVSGKSDHESSVFI